MERHRKAIPEECRRVIRAVLRVVLPVLQALVVAHLPPRLLALLALVPRLLPSTVKRVLRLPHRPPLNSNALVPQLRLLPQLVLRLTHSLLLTRLLLPSLCSPLPTQRWPLS